MKAIIQKDNFVDFLVKTLSELEMSLSKNCVKHSLENLLLATFQKPLKFSSFFVSFFLDRNCIFNLKQFVVLKENTLTLTFEVIHDFTSTNCYKSKCRYCYWWQTNWNCFLEILRGIKIGFRKLEWMLNECDGSA